MRLSQKLQAEINELRGRIRELINIEEPTEEQRNELADIRPKMETLITRQDAAFAVEAAEDREIEENPPEETPEDRELSEMIRSARVTPYIESVVENRALDGVEAELRSALEIGEGELPLALLVDWSGEEERQQQSLLPAHLQEEHRVDAVTTPPGTLSTMVTSGSWLARLFAATNASFLGVTTRPVGEGEHVYPFVAGSAEAATPAVGAAVDAVAGTIDSKTHKPRAVQARYLINKEDRLRLGNSYEGALRRDLRDQIAAGLDKFVFVDGTDGMLTVLDARTGDAALSAASTFEQMHVGILEAIDGIYAQELMDLNVSVRPAVYAYAGAKAPANTAAFLTDYLKAQGCQVRANAHLPEITGQAGESYAIISKSRGIAGAAILSVYAGAALTIITNDQALSRKRQIALDMTAYFDFSVIRKANWDKFRIAVS